MRHRKSRLRLRQKPAYSRALLRNMLTSIFLYEAIRTTKKRAMVVRPQVEKLITVAKTKSPQLAIREINRVVTHKNASRKLMEVFKSRYATRTSGYTRIVPLGARQGDGAQLVMLELMDRDTTAVAVDESAEKNQKKQRTQKSPKSSVSSKSSDSSESSKS